MIDAIHNLSRRRFLQTSALAGGGLVLGVHLPAMGQTPGAAAAQTFSPNAFIRIGTDNSITLLVTHTDMGQGTLTSLPMLIAEELDADWSKVRSEHAPVETAFGNMMVGGSTSIRREFTRLRQAGAAAREMLVAEAAAQWSVEPGTLRTDNSAVIHEASSRRATYGELAEKASARTPPRTPTLKDTSKFNLIGKSVKRLDTPEKSNGKAIFGLDVNLPGMLVAVIARPPVFGGKVKSFDAAPALAVAGVKHVQQIDRGIAVVADSFPQALQGRDALKVEWDLGALATLDSDKQLEEYRALAAAPGINAKQVGDVNTALAGAAKKLEAEYSLPYLAHAPMEPMNCVADVRADGCDVWTGTQSQSADHRAAVRVAGLPAAQVKLHTTMVGGGFGRRAAPDNHMVTEGVQLSKLIQKPVKVVWTREDDTRGGYYRPRALHVMSGGVDGEGKAVAWKHRVVCQSFFGGPNQMRADSTAVEGASDHPYAVPNILVDWKQAPNGVPTMWFRSVGHSHTAFAVESFIDELAHAAGKDPVAYRRGLIAAHPRRLRVLDQLAEKSGWGTPLPAGRGRGIAVVESFGSTVGQVAEVSVDDQGQVRVHRVVCVVDCGPPVNPSIIEAQMESGIIFGLSAALFGEITFKNGQPVQGNFDEYRVLRMDETPTIEVHVVDSKEALGGVGEPGTPPIAPAVANAIFAATGVRARSLPLSNVNLKKA